MKKILNSRPHASSIVEAIFSRFPRYIASKMLPLLLVFGCVSAAPVKVFMSDDLKLPEAPVRFWAGEQAELCVFSNKSISDPDVYLLTEEQSLMVDLNESINRPTMTKSGLYLHEFTFIAPETREKQQRYLMLYEGSGLILHFDIYPQWLREQVKRKAEAYSIQIKEPSTKAENFFARFRSESSDQTKRPVLQIVHSENDLLIQRSRNKLIWKTNFDQLDSTDPVHTLRFEAVLDALADLDKK